MHHGTCVTHVPWCMSGSLACSDGENVPGIPGACAPAILRIWQEAHVIDTQTPNSMMTSCHEHIFRVTRPLWGESTDNPHDWSMVRGSTGDVDSPHKVPMAPNFDGFFLCTPELTLNNRGVADDLRHHDAHVTWNYVVVHDHHTIFTLQWRHNDGDDVSNQPHDCLLNRLFRRRSKKHQSSESLAFVRGIHRWLVYSPHKGPVTRKMFPFDDVIMILSSGSRARVDCHCPANTNQNGCVTCGGTLTTLSGIIQSFNFPTGNYAPNMDCKWEVKPPYGQVMNSILNLNSNLKLIVLVLCQIV